MPSHVVPSKVRLQRQSLPSGLSVGGRSFSQGLWLLGPLFLSLPHSLTSPAEPSQSRPELCFLEPSMSTLGIFYISPAPGSASETCSMILQHALCPAPWCLCSEKPPHRTSLHLDESCLLLCITLHDTLLGSCFLCIHGLGGFLLVIYDHGPTAAARA